MKLHTHKTQVHLREREISESLEDGESNEDFKVGCPFSETFKTAITWNKNVVKYIYPLN